MGVVYKVRRIGLGRLVALKMILSAAGDRQFVHRSRTRPKRSPACTIPNIVQIYQVGEAEREAVLSMELIEDGSLADQQASTPLSPQASRPVVRDRGPGRSRGAPAGHRPL